MFAKAQKIMFKLLIFLCFSIVCAERVIREDLHYGTDELIDFINNLETTWTVRTNISVRF